MKIRTRLVLALFILAVLPLTGIVLYSYHSSRRALEQAYHVEAQRMTRQMDRRLTTIRTELDERLASLSSISMTGTPAGGDDTEAGRKDVVADILAAMGESAPLVDGLTIVPRPVAAPAPAAPAPPEPAETAEQARVLEPIVIDLPPVVYPSFEMPADAQAKQAEIERLSKELFANASKMGREERDRLKEAIRDLNDSYNESMEQSREKFRAEMEEAHRQMAERELRRRERQIVIRHAPKATHSSTTRVVRVQDLTPQQKARISRQDKQAGLILGRQMNVPLQKQGGEVVGQIRAQLRMGEVVSRVLGASPDDGSEVPFALDREGNIYTRNPGDKATVQRLGIPSRITSGRPFRNIENWIVVVSKDEESGLQFGVARPVGENLVELKQTAARNFGYGMGLIAFALIGIVPLANHFSRNVKTVTEGAERIAQGDLQTRVPVRSNDEFGQLATAFNKMAEDLSTHQQRLFEQERARREQEVQQSVLAVEYERKSVDLEEARRFQLSMLPKRLPRHPHYDVAVFTQTATEVGGDYYDFHDDGLLSVTIGDATGHGARAGTMVTVIKTLFAGYNGATAPSQFLGDATEKIKRMELGRMAMALALVKFNGSLVTVASAGMPPVLVHRGATGDVEEIALLATPLGTIGMTYEQRDVPLSRGDTVLLMSDGFPELLSEEGHQLGYPVAMQEFSRAAKAPTAQAAIDELSAAVRRWHGDQPPNDDITFVVVRMTG